MRALALMLCGGVLAATLPLCGQVDPLLPLRAKAPVGCRYNVGVEATPAETCEYRIVSS